MKKKKKNQCKVGPWTSVFTGKQKSYEAPLTKFNRWLLLSTK